MSIPFLLALMSPLQRADPNISPAGPILKTDAETGTLRIPGQRHATFAPRLGSNLLGIFSCIDFESSGLEIEIGGKILAVITPAGMNGLTFGLAGEREGIGR
jgi:hypothetical protein